MGNIPKFGVFIGMLKSYEESKKMSEFIDRTLTISKHEIVVDRVHEVTVVIEGGMCVDVRGLPEGWDYSIEDYDVEKQG